VNASQYAGTKNILSYSIRITTTNAVAATLSSSSSPTRDPTTKFK